MLSKKVFAIFMALVMVLGCTAFAGAETVFENKYADDPVLSAMDSEILNEVKDTIISTLPEEYQNKEFELVSGDDGSANGIALVAKRTLYPIEIQQMIDERTITLADVEAIPDGMTANICTAEVIAPFVETDAGDLINPFAAADYTSNYYGSGWIGGSGSQAGIYLYGYAYYHHYVSSSEQLIRPVSYRFKFTNSSSQTVTSLEMGMGAGREHIVHYPGFITGTNTAIIYSNVPWSDTYNISNVSPNTEYTRSTQLPSSQCVWLVNNTPSFSFYAFNGSTEICYAHYSVF